VKDSPLGDESDGHVLPREACMSVSGARMFVLHGLMAAVTNLEVWLPVPLDGRSLEERSPDVVLIGRMIQCTRQQ
jgi:hypothetical protein